MKTFAAAVVLLPLLLAPVAAQRLVAIDTNRAIVTIDPRTGATTPLVTAGAAIGTPLALAYDAAAGVMFVSSSTQDSLFTVNLVTGAATLVGSYGSASLTMHGLEYDSTNGQLYGCSSHDGGLYAIDRTTGLATLRGLSGISGTLNLGYDSRSDTLYATSTAGDSLYVVDRLTGAFTLVANLQNSINPNALAYDSQVGTLYLLDNAADQLFAIDTTTGQAHALGSTGAANNLLGLAYVPGGTGGVQRQAHGCGAASITVYGTTRPGSGLGVLLDGFTGAPFVGFGTSSIALPFCGCAIGHDWAVVVAGSNVMLPIPNSLGLLGAQVGMQGLDLFGVGGCADPQIVLTVTLRLLIG
jgi:hypothetical protein